MGLYSCSVCGFVARTGDFRGAVLLAANLADAADTVAAVTGQLAGGLNAIPDHWRERVAWKDRLLAAARRLLSEPLAVIALATLKAFLEAKPVHTAAREPVMAWYRQVKAADWASPADVKRDVRSVSILKDGRAVFNIAGNKYRIVVWINYPYRVVYIRFIGTHRMYDAIDAQSI